MLTQKEIDFIKLISKVNSIMINYCYPNTNNLNRTFADMDIIREKIMINLLPNRAFNIRISTFIPGYFLNDISYKNIVYDNIVNIKNVMWEHNINDKINITDKILKKFYYYITCINTIVKVN